MSRAWVRPRHRRVPVKVCMRLLGSSHVTRPGTGKGRAEREPSSPLSPTCPPQRGAARGDLGFVRVGFGWLRLRLMEAVGGWSVQEPHRRRYKHNPLHPQGLGEGSSAPCAGAAGSELRFGNQQLGSSGKIKLQGRGKVPNHAGSITAVMGSASTQGLWLPPSCQADGDRGSENSQRKSIPSHPIPVGLATSSPPSRLTVEGSHALLAPQLLVGDQKGLSELQVCFPVSKSPGRENKTTPWGDRAVHPPVGPMGQRPP